MAILYKIRLTKTGKLRCPICKKTLPPKLIETGYIVTHDLDRIEGNAIFARGWDGSSDGIGEHGEEERLECTGCFNNFQLPEGMEVNWL